MRKILSVLLLMTLAVAAEAGSRRDTSYIRRPEGKWIIRFRTDVGRSTMSTETAVGDRRYNMDLLGSAKIRQHIGFGYKNLILGIGINISGKKIGWDTALRILGNRFGAELSWSGVQIAAGEFTVNEEATDLAPGSFRQSSLGFKTYYAFNGRKFSLPAVITQGFRQHRSAGSALMTATAFTNWLNRKIGSDETMPLSKQSFSFGGIGGGYGYNWVPGKKWLLHISFTENIGIPWERSTIDGALVKSPVRGPGFLTSGRAAVFFYPGKCYLGITATAEHYIAPGMNRPYSVASLDIQGQASLGIRF